MFIIRLLFDERGYLQHATGKYLYTHFSAVKEKE